MKSFFKLLLLVALPSVCFGAATSSPPAWTFPGAANVQLPVTVFVKNVTVLTSGAPADIATITVPSGIVRFGMSIGISTQAGGGHCIAESASGTLAAASFQFFDGPGGTGNTLTGSAAVGPAAAGLMTTFGGPTSVSALTTSSTIYLRQTINSANAGVCSFYLTIFPLN